MAKTILAVDDSSSLRQMVAFSLKAAGYLVVEAVDGQDGLEKAGQVVRHQARPGRNAARMVWRGRAGNAASICHSKNRARRMRRTTSSTDNNAGRHFVASEFGKVHNFPCIQTFPLSLSNVWLR